MPTKLGGKALATKLVSESELATYRLEGGFVATPVYGVADGQPTEGGNLLPVYVIEAADLKENGGRFVLAKGTPVPINTYIANRNVVRDRAMPVFVVGGVVNEGAEETAPAAPSNNQVTASTTTTMTVMWTDNSDNETGFEVYQSTDNINYSLVTTTAANATSHQSTGLTDDTRYYFKVRAVNGAGNSAYSGTANGYTKLTAPSNLSVGSATPSTLTLSWTDNTDTETGFKVERSPNGSNSWVQIGTAAANATSYQDTGLSDGTTYYYRVRAYSSNQDGEYSNTANSGTTNYADPGTFEYWQNGEIPARVMKAGSSTGTFEYWQAGELV